VSKIRQVEVKLLKNNRKISDQCIVAESFLQRSLGLIGKKEFEAGEGMFFPKCKSIHMWFMGFAIDAIFLKEVVSDAESVEDYWEVTSVFSDLKPWRFFPASDWKATEVLEVPAGLVKSEAISVGDWICIN
jgi:uncharacterized protein